MIKSLTILFLLISTILTAQETSKFFESADDFFQTYVENGTVKYAEIKQNPKDLSEMMAEAKKIKVSIENPDQYKAFWINSYNLAVKSGIVKNYPVASSMDIPGFFDKTSYEIGGKKVTLNSIENELLRGKFPEPRFHFILVCAAKSCPPIISEHTDRESWKNNFSDKPKKPWAIPNLFRCKKIRCYFRK